MTSQSPCLAPSYVPSFVQSKCQFGVLFDTFPIRVQYPYNLKNIAVWFVPLNKSRIKSKWTQTE